MTHTHNNFCVPFVTEAMQIKHMSETTDQLLERIIYKVILILYQ